MITHYLKIKENYLDRLVKGIKTAEIRYNDRDYQVGDYLQFRNPSDDITVGSADVYIYFKILHVHSGLGLADGYVCMSIMRVRNYNP